MIHTVERRQPLGLGVDGCALRFRCRDFNFFTLNFRNETEGKDVFDSVQKLTCVGILGLWSGSDVSISESVVCLCLSAGEGGEEIQLMENLSAREGICEDGLGDNDERVADNLYKQRLLGIVF